MLTTIDTLRPELRKSERKVADFVLARPHRVIKSSIAVLANETGVSEPTIVRFCRAVGCKGFQDFKLKLAQNLASGIRYFQQDILPGEPPDDLTAKVFDRTIIGLMEVRNSLDPEDMNKAIEILAKAKRVEFYGQETAHIVTPEVQYRFLRLGIPVSVHSNPQVYGMAATLLKPDTAVMAICATGCTSDLLAGVELALETGATVIGITTSRSPLAERCQISFFTDLGEAVDIAATTAVSIVQRVIIDVLTAGVTLQCGPEFLAKLQQTEQRIEEKRLHALKPY